MAEIYAVCNAGRFQCSRIRRRRLILSIGDRIQVTPRLSMTLIASDGAPQTCWAIGDQQHIQPVDKPTLITFGGITRIVCRAYSPRQAVMEIQLDTAAASRDQRIAVQRASA